MILLGPANHPPRTLHHKADSQRTALDKTNKRKSQVQESNFGERGQKRNLIQNAVKKLKKIGKKKRQER